VVLVVEEGVGEGAEEEEDKMVASQCCFILALKTESFLWVSLMWTSISHNRTQRINQALQKR
jgi:hypothetical protein